MKKSARITLTVVGWAVVTWIFREKLLPLPKPDSSPPPHFRSTGGPPELRIARSPAGDDGATDAHAGDVATPQDVPGDEPEAPTSGDDLKLVKGIGPVYEHRLAEIGIRSFADLASGNAASIAEAIEVAESLVEEWIDQARGFSTKT